MINAGLSACSSTQSLRYLKLRGPGLDPDMVLFCREVNDYLPTIIRLTEMDEVGIQKTDRQLYDSRLNAVGSFFRTGASISTWSFPATGEGWRG